MIIEDTEIFGVKIIYHNKIDDDRGSFIELFTEELMKELGIEKFIQNNSSISGLGVIRGLHFQSKNPQGKLIRVWRGEIFDVVLDIRPNSPSFKKIFTIKLNGDHPTSLWIPPGLAHGFQALQINTCIDYLCSSAYEPLHQERINPMDPNLAIKWPLKPYKLSSADKEAEDFE